MIRKKKNRDAMCTPFLWKKFVEKVVRAKFEIAGNFA